jgi:hypothetical protein
VAGAHTGQGFGVVGDGAGQGTAGVLGRHSGFGGGVRGEGVPGVVGVCSVIGGEADARIDLDQSLSRDCSALQNARPGIRSSPDSRPAGRRARRDQTPAQRHDCLAGVVGLELRNPCEGHVFEML